LESDSIVFLWSLCNDKTKVYVALEKNIYSNDEAKDLLMAYSYFFKKKVLFTHPKAINAILTIEKRMRVTEDAMPTGTALELNGVYYYALLFR